jgi:putative hemolysin
MKIYGHTNMKQFDYLVLLGDVDDRYRKSYADPQSPYVIFLVPEEEVGTFVQGNGTNLGIQLTTNPATVKERGRALFERFQVTEQQLDYRLRRAKQRRNRTARS